MIVMTSTSYGGASHNRGGHGWGGYHPIHCETTGRSRLRRLPSDTLWNNRAVTAGAATIRHPVKQQGGHGWGGYHPIHCETTMSPVRNFKKSLHFTITLLNLKFPHFHFLFPFPLQIIRPCTEADRDTCIGLPLTRVRVSVSGLISIDQASFFHLTHISLSFTVISFTPNFILFDL